MRADQHLAERRTLVARLATDDLPTDDPTVAWPEDLETVEMGTAELTGPETERETGADVMVMDPTRVTDGIEPSERIYHRGDPAAAVRAALRAAEDPDGAPCR